VKLIHSVTALTVLAAASFVAGCSGKPSQQTPTTGEAASPAPAAKDCACQEDKQHRHKQVSTTVWWVRHGNAWVEGTNPEYISLCSHEKGTKAHPDKVLWRSLFSKGTIASKDTIAEIYFPPPPPFVGEGTVIVLEPRGRHVSTLRPDVGKRTIIGSVTWRLRSGRAVRDTIFKKPMQGPVVDADD